jgi:hypothetical protein
MAGTTRFGKKIRVPSTFQIKHQLLLWWLKHQAAKETAEAMEKNVGRPVAMHVHDAGS